MKHAELSHRRNDSGHDGQGGLASRLAHGPGPVKPDSRSNGHQLSAEEAITDNSERRAALSPIKAELTKMAANYFLETPKTGISVIYILINDSEVLGWLRTRA